MLRGNRNLLRRTDIKTRLTLAFIFVPLCLMIVFFLIYYSFSTTVIRIKNEQASAQMVTMSEEIFHLNANALNEQIDNLAASTYLRIIYTILQIPQCGVPSLIICMTMTCLLAERGCSCMMKQGSCSRGGNPLSRRFKSI